MHEGIACTETELVLASWSSTAVHVTPSLERAAGLMMNSSSIAIQLARSNLSVRQKQFVL